MFLVTMVMFIVLALAQAFVPNITWLIVVRFLLGIPLGSDISTGYTYIMESMAKGQREVMGNRWQFMFAIGEVFTLAVIAVFLVLELNHETVWRVTLGLGAVPALIILLLRHDVPETAVWLSKRCARPNLPDCLIASSVSWPALAKTTISPSSSAPARRGLGVAAKSEAKPSPSPFDDAGGMSGASTTYPLWTEVVPSRP